MKLRVTWHVVIKAGLLRSHCSHGAIVADRDLPSDCEYAVSGKDLPALEAKLAVLLDENTRGSEVPEGIEPSVEQHRDTDFWTFDIPGQEWPELEPELAVTAIKLLELLKTVFKPYEVTMTSEEEAVRRAAQIAHEYLCQDTSGSMTSFREARRLAAESLRVYVRSHRPEEFTLVVEYLKLAAARLGDPGDRDGIKACLEDLWPLIPRS